MLDLRKNRLAYTASLKAAQLSSNLAIMQHSVQCIATRIIIGQTLQRYNAFGDNSQADWADAANDLRAAITSTVPSGSALALQGMVFGLNGTGPGGPYGLLNATIDGVDNQVRLPTNYPNGTSAFLGDTGLGYPSMLYPNFTYTGHVNNDSSVDATASFQGVTLTAKSDLLVLGPYQFNDSLSLLSVTVPIVDLLDVASTLGWVTVVFDASLIKAVVNSSAALDETAAALLVGPSQAHNIFPSGVLFNSENRNDTAIKDQEIRYVLPLPSNLTERHPDHTVGTANPPFLMSSYPAIEAAFTKDHQAINNAGGNLKSVNEAGIDISTGFALVDFPSVNWAIVIEESRAQVWSPITKLRHVLTACVCATIGAFVLFAWPLAHFVSRPIRDLRAATMKSVMPPGYDENHDSDSDTLDGEHQNHILARKEGFFAVSNLWRKGAKRSSSEREEDARRRQFRIPGKVPERKHVVRDELTDLTSVYNEMSDELMMQYERLEERVRLRTAELELSKKAAEAANESKTLFIANISHELKTPLNGILGMCAVCMQEDDPVRLKRSLGIIYKSGDLLLNLLTDLLTFRYVCRSDRTCITNTTTARIKLASSYPWTRKSSDCATSVHKSSPFSNVKPKKAISGSNSNTRHRWRATRTLRTPKTLPSAHRDSKTWFCGATRIAYFKSSSISSPIVSNSHHRADQFLSLSDVLDKHLTMAHPEIHRLRLPRTRSASLVASAIQTFHISVARPATRQTSRASNLLFMSPKWISSCCRLLAEISCLNLWLRTRVLAYLKSHTSEFSNPLCRAILVSARNMVGLVLD